MLIRFPKGCCQSVEPLVECGCQADRFLARMVLKGTNKAFETPAQNSLVGPLERIKGYQKFELTFEQNYTKYMSDFKEVIQCLDGEAE